MLNPVLYARLQKVFKNVEVESEGVLPRLKVDSSGHWEFDRSQKACYGETFKVDCPICGDTKGHCRISAISLSELDIGGFKIDKAPLIIHCFRRNCFKGNPDNRKKVLELLDLGTPIEVDTVGEDSCFGSSADLNTDLHRFSEENLLKWQPDYHPVTEDAPAEVLDYIAERGIRECDIQEMHIGWGKCWNYKKSSFIGNNNWLLFPIIDQAGLRGFQSRQIFSNGQMKYFFDTRTPKRMCLYNRERASRFHIVAIAEGIIDALHIGRCGMAFFGSEPSKAQIKLLQQDGAKMVLYIPDQKKHYNKDGLCDLDPPAISRKYVTQWNKDNLFEWGAYSINLPAEDAGSCSMVDIWTSIIDQLHNKHVNDVILDVLGEQLKRM